MAAKAKERSCRICGCTEFNACITPKGPCSWVEVDLCSNPKCISKAKKKAR